MITMSLWANAIFLLITDITAGLFLLLFLSQRKQIETFKENRETNGNPMNRKKGMFIFLTYPVQRTISCKAL